MDFTIAGLGVMALTLAITNGIKSIFDVDGKTNQIVAVLTGTLLTFIAYGISYSMIPSVVIPYIEASVTAIAGGLSAIGLFDFVKTDLLGR